jgi:hypothetical protein
MRSGFQCVYSTITRTLLWSIKGAVLEVVGVIVVKLYWGGSWAVSARQEGGNNRGAVVIDGRALREMS